MKTEHLSPLALVMLSPNKTKEINQNGAPVLGVREGYLVGMMLKPRAEGGGDRERTSVTLCVGLGGGYHERGTSRG